MSVMGRDYQYFLWFLNPEDQKRARDGMRDGRAII